jgi:hypothetical protein
VRAVKAGFRDSDWNLTPNGCVVPTSVAPVAYSFVATNNSTGTISIAWGASSTVGATYVVQESNDPSFTVVGEIYRGNELTTKVYNRKTLNTYYYRVKAIKADMRDTAWNVAPSGCYVYIKVAPISYIFVASTSETGNYGVQWGGSVTTGVTYIVEESIDSNFTASTQVYSGINTYVAISGKTDGLYYYRVKAIKEDCLDSDWKIVSTGCSVAYRVAPSSFIFSPITNTTGEFGITWGASAGTNIYYIVEESTSSAFTVVNQVYVGPELQISLVGRTPGTYYYRVKALNGIYLDSFWVESPNGTVVE